MGWQDSPLAGAEQPKWASSPETAQAAPEAASKWASSPVEDVPFEHRFGGLKEVAETAQPLYEQSVDAIRAAAAKPWRVIQNVSERVFPLPAAITQYAKQAAESLETPTAAPAATLPEKITRGIVQGAADLPAFVLTAAAGGAPALAALGAAQELHRGPYAAVAAAGQNAIMGMLAAPLSEFTKPSQAAIYGTMNAAQTAAQGGNTSDVVASAITGAGLAVTGGSGRRSALDFLPERSEPLANPATEIRRLRGREGAPDAVSKRVEQKDSEPQHQGADVERPQAEAGGGDRVEPSAQGQEAGARVVPEIQKLRDYERRIQTDVEGLKGEEKYQALRDTAVKIAELEKSPPPEAAAPPPTRSPLGAAQGGGISLEGLEPIARAVTGAIEATKPIIRDLEMKVTPMDVGTRQTAGAAKEVANFKRAIDWESNATVGIITRSFEPTEIRDMWNRMSEESVARQEGRNTTGTGTGLDGLTIRQRETVLALQERSSQVAQQAVELGLLKDPMEIYDPRKFVELLPDGTRRVLMSGEGNAASSPMRGGARTSSPHLRERKHLTAEESEAAAQAKFGDNVELLRDVRVLPIVTAQLEHAVVGKRLINQIRAYDSAAGGRADATFSYEPGKDYFTLPENPAFHEYRNGERRPIYIHKDFEGPLKAVLESREPGGVYKGFMLAKNANSALVMASPIVHHAVIFAKALPFMPGKVATLRAYFEGNNLRQDPQFARRSVEDGVVYVDSHQFQQEVMNQMPEGLLALKPGRGIVAKLAGVVSPTAATAVDKAGAFWHQTLLWNRIGDLQASIYNTVRADLMARGMDKKTAGLTAGHFANRFGGSVPREELSATANKIANVSLFSKSFTATNVGLYLDATRGLPKSTQGVIENNVGAVARKTAQSYVRQQAAATILKDIALLYGINALTQNALEKLRGDKTWGQIGQGYADRLSRMWGKLNENPAHVLNTPFESINQLMPQGENEPGKGTRVLLAREGSGQAIYGKLAAGKTAEDLINITSPSVMFHNKLSAMAAFATQMWANQDAFGRRIYDPEAKGVSGSVANLGQIAKAFLAAQVPTDMARALWAAQHGDERKVTQLKEVLPALGVSVSRGNPKGPQGGVVAEAMREHAFQVQQGTKIGLDLIDQGKVEDAIKAMTEAGMTPQEALMLVKYRNQYGKGTMRKFFGTASPDQLEDFYRMQK